MGTTNEELHIVDHQHIDRRRGVSLLDLNRTAHTCAVPFDPAFHVEYETLLRTVEFDRWNSSQIVRELETAKVEFSGRIESTFWRDLFSWVVPLIIMAALWLFLMRRMASVRAA